MPMKDFGQRIGSKRTWIEKEGDWFLGTFEFQWGRDFLAIESWKLRQITTLFIGNEVWSWFMWNLISNVWIHSRIFRSKPCEKLVILALCKSFVLWSDAFGHGKQVCTREKWSQVSFGMFPHYRPRCKIEFRSPCSCLGQFQSTRAFSNFLWTKWSIHGLEHDTKRIKSKGYLRWKLYAWEVEVVNWCLGRAFGQVAWGMFCHFEVLSWWHRNFWFPREFWAKHGPNDLWNKINNMKKEWDKIMYELKMARVENSGHGKVLAHFRN